MGSTNLAIKTDLPKDLVIKGLRFAYGEGPFSVAVDFSTACPMRLAVLGPNGSGKTTLLKLLGGHLKPQAGSILWGADDLSELPPRLRPVSTVFQDCALFSHLTALQNVEFALRHKLGLGRKEATAEATKWLERVELEQKFWNKVPDHLSLGQQQRVAIARSLAIRPEILLLDEPSASLDVRLQQKLILLLNKVFSEGWVRIVVIVTHDLDLAFSIADRIVVLRNGKVEILEDAEDLYRYPPNAWLARFIDYHNLVSGRFVAEGVFEFYGHRLRVPSLDFSSGEATFVLQPTAVAIVRTEESETTVSAIVTARVHRGPYCEIVAKVCPKDPNSAPDDKAIGIRCFVPDDQALPNLGERVFLRLNLGRAVVFR
jgi:ABC-type Fe3+/spermidine/putrescine transport system ATPase subunit